jgi:predicted nucleic-acid-binding Zn-ribbon protein
VTQVQEQDETQDEPQAPVTTEELAEEEAEENEAEFQIHEDAMRPESVQPQMGSEKDLRALEKKLTGERDRHAKRLGDLLGDAATDALPCPLCFEGLMGFVLPGDAASLPEAQKAAALTFLGQEIPGKLRPAEGVVMCDRCDGYGELEYPTRNQHLKNQICPKCSSNGYVPVQQQQASVTNLPHVVTAADAAQNGVVMPCSRCGAPNSEGRPHFCNPQPQ